MEAFSLLKYWRGGGGVFTREIHCNPRAGAGAGTGTGTADSSSSFSSSAATVVTAVTPSSSSDSDDECNDDGPFFDLEFTLPDDDDSDSEDHSKNQADNDVAKVVVVHGSENIDEKESSAEGDVSEEDDDGENDGTTTEIKFRISSSSASDSNTAGTPGNELLFPADSSSVLVNGSAAAASETIPKFPVSSILKSATKFRVQMLKFNKSKADSSHGEKRSKSEAPGTKPVQKNEKEAGREDPKPNSKLLTVKLKVEEVMPMVSLLFNRDQSSSTNSKGATNSNGNKRNPSGSENNTMDTGESIPSSTTNEDEKKFAKELMNKYLKKVKPLYVRVSKRYGDKLKFSGQLSFPKSTSTPPPPPGDAEKQPPPAVQPSEEGTTGVAQEVGPVSNIPKGQKQGNNLQGGLRVVCKHLGKSRSASASALAPPSAAPESSKRRDDSLLQQQDGIQSAILHCKRSFNASRDMEGSILSRSVSDSESSHENR